MTSYGEALWSSAMIMTTLGSQYAARTAEGRILTLALAVYAFAVFGYCTAALASYLVGSDADTPDVDVAGAEELAVLREEVTALRAEVGALPERLGRAE